MSSINQNARMIEQDLLWLKAIIDQRIKDLPNRDTPQSAVKLNPPALDLSEAGVFYANFLQKHDLTPEERLVVVLALAPEVQPELLDSLLSRYDGVARAYTQVGGVSQSGFNGFIPTLKSSILSSGWIRGQCHQTIDAYFGIMDIVFAANREANLTATRYKPAMG